MICGNLPVDTGKIGLCYALNENGNVLCEATLVKLSEQCYWWGSAAAAEWHDRDWLNLHKPGNVTVTEKTVTHTTLVIAGPKSRALLQSLSPQHDWSAAAFPWLRAKTVLLKSAEVTVMNLSYSGELAYELHVPNAQLLSVWKLLQQVGENFRLGYFGLYAAESMRLEKGFLHWKKDLITERNPFETRLDRFVALNKPNFIGKRALIAQKNRGARKLLVTMIIDCDIAPAHNGDGVFAGAQHTGSVTSGGYGHRVNKNIAYAYVDPQHAAAGTKLNVRILGETYDAEVTAAALYDPHNKLPRS